VSKPQPQDTNRTEPLVPDTVRRLLATGETVDVRYVAKGAEAYATDSRLFILRGGETSSILYKDIAGVSESHRVAPWLILAGAALVALGTSNMVFPVAGAVLVLVGVFRGSHRLEVLVSGRSEPEVLEGAREVIGPLLQRLTERGARKLNAKV
jgi:hypothetical protein